MVACNPRDREAAHRAENEGIATRGDLQEVPGLHTGNGGVPKLEGSGGVTGRVLRGPRTDSVSCASMDETTHQVTRLLGEVASGDPDALERLLTVVYDDLKSISARQLQAEREGHTLQPTALVHEADLRLIDQDRTDRKNRTHFCSVASRLIRRTLVDHARARLTRKRGGGEDRTGFSETRVEIEKDEVELLALDEALESLSHTDARAAEIVEMRYFSGLNDNPGCLRHALHPGRQRRAVRPAHHRWQLPSDRWLESPRALYQSGVERSGDRPRDVLDARGQGRHERDRPGELPVEAPWGSRVPSWPHPVEHDHVLPLAVLQACRGQRRRRDSSAPRIRRDQDAAGGILHVAVAPETTIAIADDGQVSRRRG